MRAFGLILFIIGCTLAFGPPALNAYFGNFEIGRYPVYGGNTGYRAVTVDLQPSDAPLEIMFEARIPEQAFDTGGESTVTLVVNEAAGTVASEIVLISAETAIVTEDGILIIDVLQLPEVARGQHTFITGKGDRDDLSLISIDLVMEGNAGGFGKSSAPAGYALITAGLVVFMISLRRRRKSGPNAQRKRNSKTSTIGYREPPKSEGEAGSNIKWGRGDE